MNVITRDDKNLKKLSASAVDFDREKRECTEGSIISS